MFPVTRQRGGRIFINPECVATVADGEGEWPDGPPRGTRIRLLDGLIIDCTEDAETVAEWAAVR